MPGQLRYRTLPFLLLVAAAIAAVVALHRSSSSPHASSAAATPARAAAPTPAHRTGAQRSVPLRPAVSQIVLRFVKTSVMREHATRTMLLQGWKLTGPKL